MTLAAATGFSRSFFSLFSPRLSIELKRADDPIPMADDHILDFHPPPRREPSSRREIEWEEGRKEGGENQAS